MSPDEALQILDQAASLAPINRQSHVAAQQAVETLRDVLVGLKEAEDVTSPSRDGAKEEEVPVE